MSAKKVVRNFSKWIFTFKISRFPELFPSKLLVCNCYVWFWWNFVGISRHFHKTQTYVQIWRNCAKSCATIPEISEIIAEIIHFQRWIRNSFASLGFRAAQRSHGRDPSPGHKPSPGREPSPGRDSRSEEAPRRGPRARGGRPDELLSFVRAYVHSNCILTFGSKNVAN